MLFWATVVGNKNNHSLFSFIFSLSTIFAFVYFVIFINLSLTDMNPDKTCVKRLVYNLYIAYVQRLRTCPLMHQLMLI